MVLKNYSIRFFGIGNGQAHFFTGLVNKPILWYNLGEFLTQLKCKD